MAHLSLRKKFKTGNDKKRKISFLDDCYFSSPHTEMDSSQGPAGDDKKLATRKDNDSDGAHASPRRIMLMQVLQAEIRGKFNRAWVGRLSDQYLSARESCRIGELYNFSQSPAGTGGVGGHPFDVPAPNPRAKFVSCLDFSTTDVLLSGKCSGHVSIQCTSAATRVYDSLSAWIRELGEDNEDEPSIPKDSSPSFCELSLSSELRVFFPVGHTSALQKRERESLHTVCRDEMSGLFRPQISLSTNQRVEEVRWDPLRLEQFAMVSSTSHCLQTYDANAPNSGPHASYPQARCFSQRRGMQDFCFIDNLKVVAAGCDGGVHVFDPRCAKGVSSTLAQTISPGMRGDGCLYSIACTADGRYAYAGSASGSLHCWDLRKLGKERVSAFTLGISRNNGSSGRPSKLSNRALHEISKLGTSSSATSAVHRLRFNPCNPAQLAFQLKNGTSGALHVSPSTSLDVEDVALTHVWAPYRHAENQHNSIFFKDTILPSTTPSVPQHRSDTYSCAGFIRKPCFSKQFSRFLIAEACESSRQPGISSPKILVLDFDGTSSSLSVPRHCGVEHSGSIAFTASLDISASPVCMSPNPITDYLAVGLNDGTISLMAS